MSDESSSAKILKLAESSMVRTALQSHPSHQPPFNDGLFGTLPER
jgi:hypothetical protein